ncbi:hypothetical protein BDB01DRAFT_853480 [Pilobolus umbonatus]|nr:hypothetical protein BDB01DRAFT_853480 [Pilobolus umbonatus]
MPLPLSSQPTLYAGLVIYRIQKNVEYLLLHDSFTNKKHWFCPKGQVIGNEDELKCALRETFETTGLRPNELRVEEGFAIELKYLSGTSPKKVKYYMAQLMDSHTRLLPNAQGLHTQWCNQLAAVEKVVFKNMQDVFKLAHTVITSKQQKRGQTKHHEYRAVRNDRFEPKSDEKRYTPQPKVPHVMDNPLYKTRLCERFEVEGSCPYGLKCNFAHGVNELRGKSTETAQPEPRAPSNNFHLTTSHSSGNHASNSNNSNNTNEQQSFEGNFLFKTKLCERFMKDRFCQYGPKCHFAHGEEELKERPKREEENVYGRPQPYNQYQPQYQSYPYQQQQQHSQQSQYQSYPYQQQQQQQQQYPQQQQQYPQQQQQQYSQQQQQYPQQQQQYPQQQQQYQRPRSNSNHQNGHEVNERIERTNWRSRDSSRLQESRSSVITSEGHWRSQLESTTSQLSVASIPNRTNRSSSSNEEEDNDSSNKPVEVVEPEILKEDLSNDTHTEPEELRKPVPVDRPIQKKVTKEKKPIVNDTNEKAWMKVVTLSKEEQDAMEIQLPKSSKSTSPSKLAQTEAIISDLKKFFNNHTTTVNQGKLTDDVKEVTKIEMRNDLSKKQLFLILLASLLEESEQASASGLLAILRSRDHLFKTLVKTNADQLLLLKAWDNFVTQRKQSMVNKTAVILSHWYDCEMVEEDAFIDWYGGLEKGSLLETKSAKFIEWLTTEEDEDEE